MRRHWSGSSKNSSHDTATGSKRQKATRSRVRSLASWTEDFMLGEFLFGSIFANENARIATSSTSSSQGQVSPVSLLKPIRVQRNARVISSTLSCPAPSKSKHVNANSNLSRNDIPDAMASVERNSMPSTSAFSSESI